MLYKTLSQTHPDYSARLLQELADLYAGGYQIAERAGDYLPRATDEAIEYYEERKQLSAYLPYFGQVVDSFAADLFSQEIAVTPAVDADDGQTIGSTPDDQFYEAFAGDVDRKGTPLGKMLRGVFTTAAVSRCAYVAVDFPSGDGGAASRADEDAMGLARAYAFEVPVAQVIDWQKDERDRFQWVILHRCEQSRPSPAEARGGVVEEFKLWQLGDDGFAYWELYRTRPRKDGAAHEPDDDVPLVAAGVTTFRRIPLIELELPDGLWVGGKIGPVAKEHYQRRSSLLAAQNRSLFEIPVAFMGPEIPAPHDGVSEAQMDPHRGSDPVAKFKRRGGLKLGSGDKFEFASPTGAAYALIDQQLDRLKDELFRVVHQMAASVSNSSTSLGRSGDSKAEDRRSTQIVLCAYGALVRDLAKRIYDLVSEARGEDVVWTVHGLEGFDLYERPDIIEEALQVDAMGIPSPTFKKHYKTDLAFRLAPRLDPQTKEAVRQEIGDGVDGEVEMKAVMAEAMAAAATQPSEPKEGAPDDNRPAPPVAS